MLTKPKELKLGNTYLYWNQSTYESKPSLKRVKLINLSKDGRKARVKRFDLTVHAVQTVAVSRLLELIEEPKQESLL